MAQSLVDRLQVDEEQEDLATELEDILDVKDEIGEELELETHQQLRSKLSSLLTEDNMVLPDGKKRTSVVTFENEDNIEEGEEEDGEEASAEDEEEEAGVEDEGEEAGIGGKGLPVTGIRTYENEETEDEEGAVNERGVYASELMDDERPGSRRNPPGIENTEEERRTSVSRKRTNQEFTSEMEDIDDSEQPVAEILHRVGSDIKKTMNSKRRKLECYTKQCNESRHQVDKVLEEQKDNRAGLYEDFNKTATILLKDWEKDLNRAKANEDKIKTLYNQQVKINAQLKSTQAKRFKAIRDLHCEFIHSLANMEMGHQHQHQRVCKASNKELAALRKKFLAQSKNQDIATVRKSLQSFVN